jgi:hypothetical protein
MFSQSQKSKHMNKKGLHQNNLISNDITILTEKERNNTLTEDDIKKFRLLLAREPVIKTRD